MTTWSTDLGKGHRRVSLLQPCSSSLVLRGQSLAVATPDGEERRREERGGERGGDGRGHKR